MTGLTEGSARCLLARLRIRCSDPKSAECFRGVSPPSHNELASVHPSVHRPYDCRPHLIRSPEDGFQTRRTLYRLAIYLRCDPVRDWHRARLRIPITSERFSDMNQIRFQHAAGDLRPSPLDLFNSNSSTRVLLRSFSFFEAF